jgi:hypothetical protein
VSTTKQSHTTQNTYERNELIESCEEYEKSKIGNFENHGSFSINAVNNTQAGNQVWATDNTRISASFGPSSGVSSGETYNLGAIISSSALSTPNTHKSYGYFMPIIPNAKARI